MDDAENRGRTTDADRQRKQSHNRENGIPEQRTNRVAEILPETFYPSQPALIPICLLHLLHSTKPEPRHSPRILRAHPLPQVVLNLHLEVRADFFLQFSLKSSLQKQTKQTVKENAYSGHAPSSDGSRNRTIISDVRRQFSSSAASCFRPALVIE